jgi:hypothetical protein
VAERSSQRGGEGLSLQTLVIAAVAAGIAAVVTSYFWQRGTLISAALTPVIVAVVSEMLKRPAQTVRRAARSARTATPARPEVPLAHGAGAGPPSEGRSRELPAPREPAAAGMSEYKVYRSETTRPRFRRIHWKIVLATAGIAFVIAVGALTLPELLFGSSVNGSDSTTFFGGTTPTHKSSDKTKTDEQKTTTDNQKTTTTQDRTTTNDRTTTAPTQTAPTQSTPAPSAAPQQPAPAPSSTPTPAPQQAPSQQQAPAPSPSG